MNDVQLVDMLSGTTPDTRRRLLKWYASMTDEQRLVVKAHQTKLMRLRDRLRQEFIDFIPLSSNKLCRFN